MPLTRWAPARSLTAVALAARAPSGKPLLAGKFLALVAFIGFAVVLEIVVSSVVALVLGPPRGIATGAWTSSTGLNDTFQAALHTFLASIGYGVLGTAFGAAFRSPGVSVGLAVAYVIPIEAIVVGVIWSNGGSRLPGRLLSALAQGGTSDASYGHALVTLAVYVVVTGTGTLAVFARRDV
jgi:ABC-type transport system involved in multi-copper enzyme maturation permease subunit